MFSSEIVSHYGITQLPPTAEGEVDEEDEVTRMPMMNNMSQEKAVLP